jgi:2-methylcitrate dehydratase PrpD
MDNSLLIASTNVARLRKLKNTVTALMPPTAVVTATLFDKNNAQVTGAINLAMPFDASLNEWRGVIPSTVALVAGPYTAVVTATLIDGSVRTFTEPVPAKV